MHAIARPRRPRWLVPTSLAAHGVVLLALYVGSLWRLERLDLGRQSFDLAVAPPPPAPAPAGGQAAAVPALVPKKKKKVATGIVAPKPVEPDVKPDVTGTGSGSGSGTGSGSSDLPGTCVGDDCGPPDSDTKQPDPPPRHDEVVKQVPVPPATLKALRISGDTQLAPPDVIKTQIARDGQTRVSATLKVCLGAAGEITTVAVQRSSGYGGYDERLVEGVRAWRYRPYTIGTKGVPVCSMVTFIYTAQ